LDLTDPPAPEAVGKREDIHAYLRTVELRSGELIQFPGSGVTVIVGANNAGKSTFLRQISEYLRSGAAILTSQIPPLIKSAVMVRQMEPLDLIDWLQNNTGVVERSEVAGGPYFNVQGTVFTRQHVLDGAFNGGTDALQGGLAELFVFYADATSRLNQSAQAAGRSAVDEIASAPLHRFQDDRLLFKRLSDLSEQVFERPLLLDDYPGGSVRIRVGSVDLPVPARDEGLGEFGKQVARLPLLDEQGDGMRSFFGLLIPIYAANHRILLVDEPEAFLHPPQARALGRELSRAAADRGVQVIVATHDKDFISGLLDSAADLTVVRLVRSGHQTRRLQLESDRLREVWDDRNLRYSNVLDGLFSQLVVICESDQDCRFYEAALDAHFSANRLNLAVHTIAPSDVLFIPSNGKSGFGPLVAVLRELAVPTVVVADLDLLRSREQTKATFESLGGTWEEIQQLYTVATEGLSKKGRQRKVRSVLEVITAVLGARLESDANAIYDSSLKEQISDQLTSGSDPWAEPKKSGVAAFSGDARAAVNQLMEKLDSRGLVLVQVGELEGFSPTFAKNKEWLPSALKAESHASAEAAILVQRALDFHSLTMKEQVID
jgi:predicted ATPase